MALTEANIKSAKIADDDYMIYDRGRNGLALRVGRGGTKTWFFRFRYHGQGKRIKLGVYPWMSIKDARAEALKAAKLVAEGIDPRTKRKEDARAAEVAGVTFGETAGEWFVARYDERAPKTRERVQTTLENDVLPWIGKRPIAALDVADLWEVVDRVRKRGARATAARVRGYLVSIFRRAVRKRILRHNVAVDLETVEQRQIKHHAAVTTPDGVAMLIRAIRGYEGTYAVKCALELAPLVFVRPGEELRKAQWSEFDFDSRLWIIPLSRDKMRRGHIVPLSSQAVTILRRLQALTGEARYVFAGRDSSRPIGRNSINGALQRLDFGGAMTAHGFRATARTLLRERLGFETDVIEAQLAHKKRGIQGAYDRAEYLEQRIAMMQRWADYLDELATGVKVVTPLDTRLSAMN